MAKQIPLTAFPRAMRKLYSFLNAAANFINDYEQVTTGATATTADMTVYATRIKTNGAARVLNVGNGAGAVVGQRKLIQIVDFTATHTVVLDHANMVLANGNAAAACVLDAANEFILLEWNGAKWQTRYASTGVIS